MRRKSAGRHGAQIFLYEFPGIFFRVEFDVCPVVLVQPHGLDFPAVSKLDGAVIQAALYNLLQAAGDAGEASRFKVGDSI